MSGAELKVNVQRGAVYTLTAIFVTAIVGTCVTLWRRPSEGYR